MGTESGKRKKGTWRIDWDLRDGSIGREKIVVWGGGYLSKPVEYGDGSLVFWGKRLNRDCWREGINLKKGGWEQDSPWDLVTVGNGGSWFWGI
jgi:hypothetical protein